MTKLEQEQLVVDGVRSPVRWSAPDGRGADHEAVVFVHGNPGSSEDWIDLLTATGEFARSVAPDLPGYGKADRPVDFEYTVGGYARHLHGTLERLGIEKAHLVLHDFGGPWGMRWAAEHGDRVASLTLLNVGALPGYRWHKFARLWRTPVLGELSGLVRLRWAFRAMLNADNPRRFPDAFVDRMFDDLDAGTFRAVLALYRATGDPGGDTTRDAAKIRSLSVPSLVLWGEGDKYLPVSYAEHQLEHLGAEVHILPDCGHWPMIDDPDTVRGLVVPFLREQLRVSG